jgi:sugar phosphate isomerase/epimerase
MRLGGQIFATWTTPDEWVRAVQQAGYRAAYCPLKPGADAATVRAYALAAQKADIVIAEVGAWSNPLSPDAATRQAALDKCRQSLALADEIGARCCVNIAGSRGEKWDGPHPADLTEETFDMIVATTRAIIDAVQPTRSYFTLETMPWMYPDSADSYLRLLKAIDRPHCAAHLDPVNLVNCPQRYFENAALLRECFAKLGPYIKSCHAKDILLHDKLTVHLDEVRPGLGKLDYRVYLSELNRLDADMPLMIEHLPNEQEFALAAHHIRSVAGDIRVELR